MSKRMIYFLSFLGISGLLLISVYLQMYDGFVPCPLCTLQRLTFAILALVFLIGVIVCRHRGNRIAINIIAAWFALLGVLLAGRQLWLQFSPSADSSECGVSLQYMLQALPLTEVMQKIFLEGTAECSQRGWEIFYLNMAEWSLIWFGLFFILSLWLLIKEFKTYAR